MRSPVYSMSLVPVGIARAANTPSPAMGELRTSNSGVFDRVAMGAFLQIDSIDAKGGALYAGAMGIRAGDTAPDFTLPRQDGSKGSLKDLLAKGPVVLYFYPKD